MAQLFIELSTFHEVGTTYFADSKIVKTTYCGPVVNEICKLLRVHEIAWKTKSFSILVVNPRWQDPPTVDPESNLRNWYLTCTKSLHNCEAVLLKYNGRVFPVDILKFVGLPLNSHPGAFGCVRKFNVHEGIDLYGHPEDPVYAIDKGTVVNVGPFTGPEVNCPWWLPTFAVTVKSERGYFVYGELKPCVHLLEEVYTGTKIGELMPVLPESKRRSDIPCHSVTMLHLEKYNLNTYDEHMEWQSWVDKSRRPVYLEDPTSDLLEILSKLDLNNKYMVM